MRVLQIVAFKEAFTDRMQLQSLTNKFEEENNFVPLASSNVTSQCPRATLSFESASISWNSKTSGEAQFDDACDGCLEKADYIKRINLLSKKEL